MTQVQGTLFFLVLTLLASALNSAQAQEKKINRSELPAVVEKTVEAQAAGASLRGFSKETENGRVLYEAELTMNGHSKDILIDETGKVVEVEEQVDIDALSPSVRNALLTKAGTGKIVKVETLTKNHTLVAFEAQVRTSGKRLEIQVGPNGEALSHEE